MIILLNASEYEKPHTMWFLKENNVRYDHIIFNAGEGERIMINDADAFLCSMEEGYG